MGSPTLRDETPPNWSGHIDLIFCLDRGVRILFPCLEGNRSDMITWRFTKETRPSQWLWFNPTFFSWCSKQLHDWEGLWFFWCSTLSFIKTKPRCQQIWCKWTAEWGWVVWLDSWWSVIRCSFESWRACSGGSTIHCSQRILGRRWQAELGGASKGVQPVQQVCCWISWSEVMNSTVFLLSVYFIYKITYTHVFLFHLGVKIVAYFWFSYFENNRNIESSISFTDVSWWLELLIGLAFT